jgi:hypothetical protein
LNEVVFQNDSFYKGFKLKNFMNLRNVKLRIVDDKTFSVLHSYWCGVLPKANSRINKAVILRTIAHSSYDNLLEDFLKNPYAHQISFYDCEKGWGQKRVSEGIQDWEIKRMSKIALNNTKRNAQMKLIFKEGDKIENQTMMTRVYFRRIEDKVLGYQIKSPIKDWKFFNWISGVPQSEYKQNIAMLIPKKIREKRMENCVKRVVY